jgi:SPP1 gp7 family putative phage head morphogenesis protein
VAREQRRGARSETIAKALREKVPGLAKSRIRTIARTEVGKAETAFTEARSERLGIRWYEWATGEDQRVRPSHRKLARFYWRGAIRRRRSSSPESAASWAIITRDARRTAAALRCR